MITRRELLLSSLGAGVSCAALGMLPAWARSATQGNLGLVPLTGDHFDLTVDSFPIRIDGRQGRAIGMNDTLPAPLIRFREGDEVTLDVANKLDEDTSIHWHGLLVPFYMDGVPGVSFPGIPPGETFRYRFAVPQNGTYWYHSHSGSQEQAGHYGPLIVEPRGADPVSYDREYVLVLSDWSFMDPDLIFHKLKASSEFSNHGERTLEDFFADVAEHGWGATFEDRAMWGRMRMSPRDISDVTGDTYLYLINGHSTADNWNGVFEPGERVRLRLINASAMTIFNVRIPGLPMTVVQSDGLNTQPLEVDELQIGVAETYDVIVTPPEPRAYGFVAESIERAGLVVATLGPRPGMRAEPPPLRAVPTLTMKDMGMDHGGMDHGGMDHGGMDHGGMDHGGMDHGAAQAPLERGPGVMNIAESPANRLDEPGTGLEDVPHRALRYSQLRSLEINPDTRPPGRELDIHLTGNMDRYIWSFDGVKFSEVTAPITLYEGERVRLTMTNNTMMNHPVHLHGMYFELGQRRRRLPPAKTHGDRQARRAAVGGCHGGCRRRLGVPLPSALPHGRGDDAGGLRAAAGGGRARTVTRASRP